MLLLAQPAVLLYDRMVMQGAAAEVCRLLATVPSEEGAGGVDAEDYVRRRLGAVPQQDLFHVHEGGCTWEIDLESGEGSESVRATIRTEARPLPLLGAGAALLGLTNDNGNLTVEVSVEMPTQPAWAQEAAAGRNPAEWIGAWRDTG